MVQGYTGGGGVDVRSLPPNPPHCASVNDCVNGREQVDSHVVFSCVGPPADTGHTVTNTTYAVIPSSIHMQPCPYRLGFSRQGSSPPLPPPRNGGAIGGVGASQVPCSHRTRIVSSVPSLLGHGPCCAICWVCVRVRVGVDLCVGIGVGVGMGVGVGVGVGGQGAEHWQIGIQLKFN